MNNSRNSTATSYKMSVSLIQNTKIIKDDKGIVSNATNKEGSLVNKTSLWEDIYYPICPQSCLKWSLDIRASLYKGPLYINNL